MGTIDVLVIIGMIAMTIGVFVTKTIPIDSGAFILAFGLSIMAYIGMEMFVAWRNLKKK